MEKKNHFENQGLISLRLRLHSSLPLESRPDALLGSRRSPSLLTNIPNPKCPQEEPVAWTCD